MLRYAIRMRFRACLAFLALSLALGSIPGCGDETGISSSGSSGSDTLASLESQTGPGVEITGNVINGESLLVFAFLRSGDNASDEPVSVGIIDDEGQFTLSGLPAGRIGITFLADGTNDGVIDPGDPIASLADPDQQLQDLHEGDHVHLADVQLDLVHKRAVADVIEVNGASDSAPESTPTPEQ